MAAKSRRSYKGAAISNALASGGLAAGATTVSLASAMSGWPTGTAPFFIVVDPGTAKEEKICVQYATTTTLTVVDPAVTSSWSASANGRGVDDTTDRTHDGGATVYPVFTAYEANQANELVSTFSATGHMVYQGASTFAGLAIGTAAQVLKVNSGATAPEWGQVATAGIADSAVTSAKIADGTIVLADLAAALQAFLVPVGTIAMWGGASAPTGWLLCDGTSTTGYTALAAIVGSTTPDMRGRFPIGDNSTLTLLGTGGSTTIAEGNLPSHTHTFSATSGAMSANATLSHNITDPGHSHTINGETATRGLDGPSYDLGALYDDLGNTAYTESTATATTGISIDAHSVAHTHSVSGTTDSGSGSGTAYYQPYLVVNYIIKHD